MISYQKKKKNEWFYSILLFSNTNKQKINFKKGENYEKFCLIGFPGYYFSGLTNFVF